MGFYEDISAYYDYIFPVGQQSLEFIRQSSGPPPRRLLDIACGAGGHSIELAKAGYSLTASDLDAKMVEKAENRALELGLGIRFLRLDMRNIADIGQGGFDLAYCIGNSVVHLGGAGEVLHFLTGLRPLLRDGGKAVFQIINYDRVAAAGIAELPPIINEERGLSFMRKYSFNGADGLVNFDTVLTVADGNGKKTFTNSIRLFPLKSAEFSNLLLKADFKGIELFGDFAGAAYRQEESYMLVVRAQAA